MCRGTLPSSPIQHSKAMAKVPSSGQDKENQPSHEVRGTIGSKSVTTSTISKLLIQDPPRAPFKPNKSQQVWRMKQVVNFHPNDPHVQSIDWLTITLPSHLLQNSIGFLRQSTLIVGLFTIVGNCNHVQRGSSAAGRCHPIPEILCTKANPPIHAIIKMGVVPYFVSFLRRMDIPQLQLEAACVLTNIASGTSEQTTVVVESGAVPLFIELLCSPNDDLREPVAWGLGNIAGNCPKYRDIVLSKGGMINLLALFNENAKIETLRTATWTLANFCRGIPCPPFEQVKAALPILKWLIYSGDEDILADACWTLSYISDGDIDVIQAIIETGVCANLAEIIRHPLLALLPALRTIGNLVTGDDVQTQHVLDNGILPRLLPLLAYDYNKIFIIKDACWAISNIAAGNQDQIQAVINEGLIPPHMVDGKCRVCGKERGSLGDY